MLKKLQEAEKIVKNNIVLRVKQIDALSIPLDFKSVFIHLIDEPKVKLNEVTMHRMEIIGQTKSKVCLDLLESGKQKSRIIIAYHLTALLNHEYQRETVVNNILSSQYPILTEIKILLEIIALGGKEV